MTLFAVVFAFLITPSNLQILPNYRSDSSYNQQPNYQHFLNPNNDPNNNPNPSLPFTCPNQPPLNSPRPPYLGFFPNKTLDDVSNAEYSQFLAALALKPCDEDAIQVFTNSEYNGGHSVALIFTENSSRGALEMWIR